METFSPLPKMKDIRSAFKKVRLDYQLHPQSYRDGGRFSNRQFVPGGACCLIDALALAHGYPFYDAGMNTLEECRHVERILHLSSYHTNGLYIGWDRASHREPIGNEVHAHYDWQAYLLGHQAFHIMQGVKR
jgi:hypothetical protein